MEMVNRKKYWMEATMEMGMVLWTEQMMDCLMGLR